MHKVQQALPRLRPSFAGVSAKSSKRNVIWCVLPAVCALLVLGAYVATTGYIWWSSSTISDSSRRGSQDYFSSKRDFEPVAAAVAALQKKAAKSAAAQAAKAMHDAQQQIVIGAEAMQQLQQGVDTMATSMSNIGGMTRSLHEQSDLVSSHANTSPSALQAAHVNFVDTTTDIRSSTDAMASRPQVHGHVTKQGIADATAWMGKHSDSRLDSFISWRINRTRAGGAGVASANSYTCAAADHPRMPFPGCHVFVNHNPKSASTSIVNMLGECNNKATHGHNSSSCMVLNMYWNSTELSSELVQKMWKEYFVFSFVRNPWRRAYSLYKYLHSNGCMSEEKLHDPGCHVPWPNFCVDPWAAAELLHDKGCIKRSKSYLYFHMQDHYHCMRTADGQWAVDFIGRVDHPNDDWAEVVQALNSNRAPGIPALPALDLEQKNVRAGHVKNPYQKPGANQCFDSVSRWYACDVEHFGFANFANRTTLNP